MCRHSKGAATNAVGDATDTARDGIAPEHIAPDHKEAAPSGRLIVREPDRHAATPSAVMGDQSLAPGMK